MYCLLSTWCVCSGRKAAPGKDIGVVRTYGDSFRAHTTRPGRIVPRQAQPSIQMPAVEKPASIGREPK